MVSMPRRTGYSNANPRLREQGVLAFLDKVPRELQPLLIGAYAVSAYGPPRFSDDVDLVLPASILSDAKDWLVRAGLRHRTTYRGTGDGEGSSKLRIEGGLLTGDLYFGGLTARGSETFVDYRWLSSRSQEIQLTLLTGRLRAPFPVARPEALWVLKLLAGRPQDITDLFAISPSPIDPAEVVSKLSALSSKHVNSALRALTLRVSSDKEYRDALSRRGLGSPDLPENIQRWARFKKTVESIFHSLPDH